jgi:hypothetical protein
LGVVNELLQIINVDTFLKPKNLVELYGFLDVPGA